MGDDKIRQPTTTEGKMGRERVARKRYLTTRLGGFRPSGWKGRGSVSGKQSNKRGLEQEQKERPRGTRQPTTTGEKRGGPVERGLANTKGIGWRENNSRRQLEGRGEAK